MYGVRLRVASYYFSFVGKCVIIGIACLLRSAFEIAGPGAFAFGNQTLAVVYAVQRSVWLGPASAETRADPARLGLLPISWEVRHPEIAVVHVEEGTLKPLELPGVLLGLFFGEAHDVAPGEGPNLPADLAPCEQIPIQNAFAPVRLENHAL